MLIKSILKKWVPKGKFNVLDLGCGLGNLSVLFSPKNYLGVDLDEKSIEIAKKNYPKYSFKVGSITSFSTNKKFDLIMVIGVFHHISDTDMTKGLQVIKNHIQRNGRVIIIESIPPVNKWNLAGHLVGFLHQAKFKAHFIRSFTEYRKKIEKKLRILYSNERKGGAIDYAVFVAASKNNK